MEAPFRGAHFGEFRGTFVLRQTDDERRPAMPLVSRCFPGHVEEDMGSVRVLHMIWIMKKSGGWATRHDAFEAVTAFHDMRSAMEKMELSHLSSLSISASFAIFFFFKMHQNGVRLLVQGHRSTEHSLSAQNSAKTTTTNRCSILENRCCHFFPGRPCA